LWAYTALGAIGLVAALVSGRAELAVAVAPVALIALAGVVLAERPALDAAVVLPVDRTLEGSAVDSTVAITCSSARAVVDVVVPFSGPLTIEDPAEGRLAWSSAGGGVERRLRLAGRATSWGIVRLGPVWTRAHGPLGLVRWDAAVGHQKVLRVLPSAPTLRSLLPHHDPRATAGPHLARRPGDGIEFADARPYQPGDRLRSINWRLSSRRGDLWVDERHPERSADLVVLVDTFADDASDASLALARTVRVAWMLAQAHLAGHDRVGLIAFGGYPAWLAPGSGERARYEVLDKLLATTAAWTEARRSVQILPRQVIPPGASIVAVTPLHDRRMVDALADLRHRGLAVAAVRVDATDRLPPSAAFGGQVSAVIAAAAVRIWRLELERRALVLGDAGVPVVLWAAGHDPASVLASLRRVGRAPARRWA
jgi:uncharacterized protein (DUF58 family)